ncbi:lactonase family protein [Agrilactobacillus yilanensis]|uniref:Lactonase family protein n=1 Tax=Agrilactobacillus yilanensis TaxID=2485997 RepID=A0ABW4J9V5_9LACO|nr:lactonase family protein [Agrilactobacillus yilanensis]
MRETLYLGGYTRRLGLGIYKTTLENGQLAQPELFLTLGNPTYFTIDSANQRLFSIMTHGQQGGVAAYDISGATPQLINQVLAPGSSPAYIAYDAKRQLVFDANYHKGQANAYKVSPDGVLTLVDTVSHHGHGPKKEQAAAHVHYTDLTPDNRLVTCDLGTDTVTLYDFKNYQFQKLTDYQTTPGFGPRHIIFHPTAHVAYVLGELASAVTVLDYEPSRATLSPVQTVNLLPEDYTAFNGSAAIRLSPDGRFLYASNRGHNSLAVFAISQGGRHLNLVQRISTQGDGPRDFNLNATGEFIVAANQNTDNLTLFQRDSNSGRLTLLQKDVPCPEGTCVQFYN